MFDTLKAGYKENKSKELDEYDEDDFKAKKAKRAGKSDYEVRVA